MKWCHPYSGRAFLPLLSFSGKTMLGTPRSEWVCFQVAKSVKSDDYLSQLGRGVACCGQAVDSHLVTR